jgi:hypothetical protein
MLFVLRHVQSLIRVRAIPRTIPEFNLLLHGQASMDLFVFADAPMRQRRQTQGTQSEVQIRVFYLLTIRTSTFAKAILPASPFFSHKDANFALGDVENLNDEVDHRGPEFFMTPFLRC